MTIWISNFAGLKYTYFRNIFKVLKALPHVQKKYKLEKFAKICKFDKEQSNVCTKFV